MTLKVTTYKEKLCGLVDCGNSVLIGACLADKMQEHKSLYQRRNYSDIDWPQSEQPNRLCYQQQSIHGHGSEGYGPRHFETWDCRRGIQEVSKYWRDLSLAMLLNFNISSHS